MRRLSFLLLCFAGCQCQPPPPDTDAGVDAGSQPGALEFTLSPFTPVLRGEWLDRTGTFKTTGTEDAEVTGLALTGDGFALIGPSSLRVPAGGEATLTVRLQPTTLGRQTAVLTWNRQTLTVEGIGIGPALGLQPAPLDLGTVPLYEGAPARAATTLTVRNTGLDATPSNPATALQIFFDVQSTSAAPSGELCAGDCSAASLSVPVGANSVVPVQLTSTTTGVKSWDVRVFSNDPSAPMRTIPVTAEVVARPTCQFAVPARLDFGVVTQPERRELELIFENVGSEPCDVSRIEVSPQTLFSVLSFGAQTVAPGSVLRVVVRAWPQSPAPLAPILVTDELRLQLNHPDGFARVALSAELGLSCLWVSPSPLDFGTVKTSCRSADRTVTLKNVCARSLVVTSAALPGFSSFSASAALPRTLAADEAVTLTARYTPFAVGPSRDVIDVSWLDGTLTRHTMIPLVGEANATGDNVDRFPPAPNKLDVLVVLDDSASMADNAAQVVAQLPGLLTELQARGLDFHLGVVTAGTENPAGVLRRVAGSARWLSSATVDLPLRFAELTAFTGTHERESCEVPALAALTPPLINDATFNGGFRRADAALSVLCITDRSEGFVLLSRVLELPTRPRWDVIGPVAPSAPGCLVDWNPAQNGFPAYADATGGEVLDVCAADWSPLLTRIARQTTGPRSVFPLRLPPDPLGDLAVTVAGQPVSRASGAWVWESTPNLVRFVPAAAPPASAPVKLSYPTICTP